MWRLYFISNRELITINTSERAGFFGDEDGDGVVLFHAAKKPNILQ